MREKGVCIYDATCSTVSSGAEHHLIGISSFLGCQERQCNQRIPFSDYNVLGYDQNIYHG